MKFIAGAALGCLLLAGCQQPNSSGSKTESLTVTSTSTSTYKFYSLATGEEVTDPATQAWDIAFSSGTQGVLTNSGATATKKTSGGNGGVYYAQTIDFDAVSSYDAAHFGDAFAVDTTKFANTVTGSDPDTHAPIYTALPVELNQFTLLEYGGTGTEGDPFTIPADENGPLASVYAGNAYYTYDAGVIAASGEVYVVRHGDGTHYSKLQIVSITGDSSSRVRVIKYKNF